MDVHFTPEDGGAARMLTIRLPPQLPGLLTVRGVSDFSVATHMVPNAGLTMVLLGGR